MAASYESNVDSDFEDRMEVAFADDEISANVDEDVYEAVDDVKVIVSTILDEIISKVVGDEVVDSVSDAENVHDCKYTFILAYFFVHFKTHLSYLKFSAHSLGWSFTVNSFTANCQPCSLRRVDPRTRDSVPLLDLCFNWITCSTSACFW